MAHLNAPYGGPFSTNKVEILVAAALAAGYPSPSNAARIAGNRVVFHLTWVIGDETTVELQPQGSADDGTTWEDLTYVDVQSSGVSAISVNELRITKGSLSGTKNWGLPPIDCSGYPLVRLLPKKTGGSSPGTMAVSASFVLSPKGG